MSRQYLDVNRQSYAFYRESLWIKIEWNIYANPRICDDLQRAIHNAMLIIKIVKVWKQILSSLLSDPRGGSDITDHYNDVIMGVIAYRITSLTIVCSTFYTGVDQNKYQSSASLAFVRGNHRGPVNWPPEWPVTRKMFPFDAVILCCE